MFCLCLYSLWTSYAITYLLIFLILCFFFFLLCCFFFFFFFKQKTAYEIHSRLEFRRVLFRSLAMVIISVTMLPIYYKLKVYTAYEYLETRFDLKTRTLAAILFLILRGLSAGITLFAPRSEERRVGKECRSRW